MRAGPTGPSWPHAGEPLESRHGAAESLPCGAVQDWLRDPFPYLALATWLIVPLYAAVQRGRTFAIFSAVTFGIALAGAGVVHARLPGWAPASLLPTADSRSHAEASPEVTPRCR